MGNSVAKAIDTATAQSEKNESAVLADLNNLNEILLAKTEEYFTKLVNSNGEDKTIPIKTLIEYKKHTSCSVSKGPSEQLNNAVEELFGGNFMSSLKAMALGAINTVLGNTSAGSKQETGYKVLLLNNTIVRVDYYVYGFNMHTTGVYDKTKNGLAFVATVGVVDMQKVGLEALVYLVGSQANAARVFLDQRYAEWQDRLNMISQFKTILEATTDPTKLPKDGPNVKVEDLMAWQDEVAAEEDAEDDATPARSNNAAEPVVTTPVPGGTPTPPGSTTTTTPVADPLKIYLTTTETEPAKRFPLMKAAWLALEPATYSAIQKMVLAHKDLLRAMTREQENILDDMEKVYRKARSVTNAISGIAV